MKLNYGEKVKGVFLEEDAPFADPESVLPSLVTRRILWRVAQSQYYPLGLLSVYMVKWKLLMRKVTFLISRKEVDRRAPLTRKKRKSSGAYCAI
jgi:hypothetical protein